MTFPIFDLLRTLLINLSPSNVNVWEWIVLSFNDRERCRAIITTTSAFRFFFLSFCLLPTSPRACLSAEIPHIPRTNPHIPPRDTSKDPPLRTRATHLQYSRIRFLQATTSDTIVTVSNIESTNFSVDIRVCVKCLRGIPAIEERKLYISRILAEIDAIRVTTRRDFKFLTDFSKILNIVLSC